MALTFLAQANGRIALPFMAMERILKKQIWQILGAHGQSHEKFNNPISYPVGYF